MNNPSIPKGKSGDAEAAEQAPAGNVDKIRDILFGSNMREYDQRFGRLEERLLQESAELREESKRRFAALENYVKGEVNSLHDDIKAGKAERVEADREIVREQKEINKALEKRTIQIEEAGAKSIRDVRQQLLEEAKRLTDAMEDKFKELSTRMARDATEQRDRSADRRGLADLFELMAVRLRDEEQPKP